MFLHEYDESPPSTTLFSLIIPKCDGWGMESVLPKGRGYARSIYTDGETRRQQSLEKPDYNCCRYGI